MRQFGFYLCQRIILILPELGLALVALVALAHTIIPAHTVNLGLVNLAWLSDVTWHSS